MTRLRPSEGTRKSCRSKPQRLLIANGLVYDGTGAPGRQVDLLIEGDRIADIGRLGPLGDVATLNAMGLCITPGFIDPHNHADSEIKGGIVAHPRAENLIRQGITTLVCNQCGGSIEDVGAFFDRLSTVSPVTNVAMLASHGHARRKALKQTGANASTPAMWACMRDLLRAQMEAGALGVTTGIIGVPKERIPTEELIEAGRAVAPFEGVYASHIRDEGEYNCHLDAINEVAAVARETGARGHVSHLKLWGHPNWGKTEDVLAIFDQAKADGIPLAADQYPYIGGYRGFYSLLWDKQRSGPYDAAWRRDAEDEVTRQLDVLGGAHRLYISSHEPNDPLDGLTIGEAAEKLSISPPQVVTELYLRTPRPRLSAFFLAMCEEDVRVFMASEHTMAGTDSHLRIPGSGASHPRNFGVYPRLLGKYVREETIMPMETMVRRMTSRVAEQFGIRERGVLRSGAFADIVIFNPDTVRDRGTWRNGYLAPVGIEHVFVNGGHTVVDGELVGEGNGRGLPRRP
ncbi:MAG: amidohydrolase family protein [Lentisphaerae bacterium]|jgi:N-acyl-D-amino-acid deacylase|nr:amidohydrolase family protein [Lentisphaerota bacterium]MBT5611226.1 amidohydrolase family protein [Lentisphaerota bacterium]MBT7059169.1 amidohydrolase family protein [Lentisphaerota bacterium]MBT7842933.1 amidohydrolase family protein [Lentisphaerota bacterium]